MQRIMSVLHRHFSSKTLSHKVLPAVINRNPRNLEQMRIEPKRQGWEFQSPSIHYWNKCVLVRSGADTVATIVHNTGVVILQASTQEKYIRKNLYSGTDVSAAQNIGHVLAQRCLQMGIDSVFFDTQENPLTSEATQMFHAAMTAGGVHMQEPEMKIPPEQFGVDYDSLTVEERRALYPSLIQELRNTPDWGEQKYPYSLRPMGKGFKKRGKYQILVKVREGQWWDPIYHQMSHAEDRPHWRDEPVDEPPFVLDKMKATTGATPDKS